MDPTLYGLPITAWTDSSALLLHHTSKRLPTEKILLPESDDLGFHYVKNYWMF